MCSSDPINHSTQSIIYTTKGIQEMKQSLVFLVSLLCFVGLALAGNFTQCSILNIQITTERAGPGLSAQDVINHIGTPLFLDPSQTHWSCIDGRATNALFATPGGDSGEWVVALTLYDIQMYLRTGLKLDAAGVAALFDEWMTLLNPNRQWFLHTDEQTLQLVRQALNDPAFNPVAPVWTNTTTQAAALQVLTQAPYVGCPYLRLVMQYPDQYNIPVQIVQWYLAAYYQFMWNHAQGSRLNYLTDFEELYGGHREQAVVTVYSKTQYLSANDPCQTLAPLMVPTTPENSIFFYNAGAVNVGIRNQIAQYFADKLDAVHADDFVQQMNAIMQNHFELTTSHVSGTLPMYTVTVVVGSNQPDMLTPDKIHGTLGNMFLTFASLIVFFSALAAALVWEVIKWKRHASAVYLG